MNFHAFGENGRIVAAFENADDSPSRIGIGDVQHGIGKGLEIFGFQTQVADGVQDDGCRNRR